MSTVFTRYRVLVPTSVQDLYEEIGIYALETEQYETRLPEYVQSLLVKSGKLPPDIKVIRIVEK